MKRWERKIKGCLNQPCCPHCGYFGIHRCTGAVCLCCGSRQCQGNGLGNGQCSICYVGLLEGWSGSRAGLTCSPGKTIIRRADGAGSECRTDSEVIRNSPNGFPENGREVSMPSSRFESGEGNWRNLSPRSNERTKLMSLIQTVKKARSISTPLLAVTTPDPAATIAAISTGINGDAFKVQYDLVNGLKGVPQSPSSVQAVRENGLEGVGGAASPTGIEPLQALQVASGLPAGTVLFLINAHRLLESSAVTQAVWNLRDQFKADGRTLILLAPSIRLPIELQSDVLMIDEPLPDEERIKSILSDVVQGARSEIGKFTVTPQQMDQAVAAMRGLAAFPIEQSASMAVDARSETFNIETLWASKRAIVEQTPGVKFRLGGPRFEDVGGLDALKDFGAGLFKGAVPPNVVVRLDEADKAFAGAASEHVGDNGVNKDALGCFLQEMENEEYDGIINVGPPGTGKTFFSTTLAATFGRPLLEVDLGALKGGIQGESEQNIRMVMKVIRSIAGHGGAFFIATANAMDFFPPALIRRFNMGVYFSDLASPEEKADIWKINIVRYELPNQEKPDDTDWSAAEIRNCCKLAWRLGKSLVDASRFLTPVSKSDPESIEKLRTQASGRLLSASYPGFYRKPERPIPTGRKFNLSE